jgi:hypothetical protein
MTPQDVGGSRADPLPRPAQRASPRGASVAPRVPTPHVRPIVHRHRIAALAAERVYYASHIEVLEPDHPERRFVAALCLYSHAIDTGQAGCAHYGQEAAERFARALLMPAETFDAQLRRPDVELAERFIAPLDHVGTRRRERGRERTRGR